MTAAGLTTRPSRHLQSLRKLVATPCRSSRRASGGHDLQPVCRRTGAPCGISNGSSRAEVCRGSPLRSTLARQRRSRLPFPFRTSPWISSFSRFPWRGLHLKRCQTLLSAFQRNGVATPLTRSTSSESVWFVSSGLAALSRSRLAIAPRLPRPRPAHLHCRNGRSVGTAVLRGGAASGRWRDVAQATVVRAAPRFDGRRAA